MRNRLHSVYIVRPRIGPESIAEKLIGMGNIEEVRLKDHSIGYLVKVRFMFKEPGDIEKYLVRGIGRYAAAVASCK